MLTTAQLTTLADAIAAETDPEFVAYRTNGQTTLMAAWFNDTSSLFVWKTELSEHDITSQVSSDATVWSWSAFISRSQGERDGWARMFNGTYTINPSLPQVRNGLADIFSGGTGSAQRTHLLAIGKRLAQRGEALYANTSASPASMTFVGDITDVDISRALSL